MFFKSGLLRQIYPFSAALTMIGFDTSSYSGTSDKGSVLLAAVSLGSMLLIAVVLVCISKAPEDAHKKKKAKGRGRSSRRGQQQR